MNRIARMFLLIEPLLVAIIVYSYWFADANRTLALILVVPIFVARWMAYRRLFTLLPLTFLMLLFIALGVINQYVSPYHWGAATVSIPALHWSASIGWGWVTLGCPIMGLALFLFFVEHARTRGSLDGIVLATSVLGLVVGALALGATQWNDKSTGLGFVTHLLPTINWFPGARGGFNANEIAGALAIPVSSLSYLLNTLVERDYLARDGRRYTAGPGLERLHARSHDFSIADRTAPLVRSLRLQINETVSFFVRRGWEMQAIVTESSDHALRYAVQTGSITPLYCYSAGKALLATLSEDELERYLAEVRRPALTATTITDPVLLRQEIAEVRRTGIAHTREESTPGIQGLGRAVVVDGTAVGAFAIAIPTVRFDPELQQRAIELLVTTSALLSR